MKTKKAPKTPKQKPPEPVNAIVKASKPEPYLLRDLIDKKSTFDISTNDNIKIPISIALLTKFFKPKQGERPPTDVEVVMFANMIIAQGCNPYLEECWPVFTHGQWKPIISAQKRIAKAQSMPEYDGYEWGWITKDNVRHEAGPTGAASVDNTVGAWGRVYFKNRKVPFYHEILFEEYSHGTRPVTMLLKTMRDQTHKYAFANQMGNLVTENESPFIESDGSMALGPASTAKRIDNTMGQVPIGPDAAPSSVPPKPNDIKKGDDFLSDEGLKIK